MNRESRSVLHCFPFGGGGGWGGGRERLPIDATIRPVHERVTVISLPHACLAAGLLETESKRRSVDWCRLAHLVQDKWAGSVERFLLDAGTAGATFDRADAVAAALHGAVIGWAGPDSPSSPAAAPFGVCPDLNLTLAILGRRVANMFVAARTPDYSWSALFGSTFAFDDDLCEAPLLADQPWSRFRWAADFRGDSE